MPPVVILTGDLFFRVKIEAVAEAVGTPVAFARSREEVERALEDGGVAGSGRVLIDLSYREAEPTETIRTLKSRPEPPHVVAFGPHRDGEAFRAARQAGADRVLARSAFVERLPKLLRGESGGA
ncbi:MAG: hypothetical protein ACREMD_04710 [Gemmatimonadota bacterium]